MWNVPTPTIDAVVRIASTMLGVNYFDEGLSVEDPVFFTSQLPNFSTSQLPNFLTSQAPSFPVAILDSLKMSPVIPLD